MKDTQQILKEHLSQLGKKGGRATKKNHGLNHFKNLGRMGAEKRWGKKSPVALDTK